LEEGQPVQRYVLDVLINVHIGGQRS